MKMKKDFDCVEMKNEIQKRLYERRKNMTHQQELEDIEKRLTDSQSPIAQWWRRIEKKDASSGLPQSVNH